MDWASGMSVTESLIRSEKGGNHEENVGGGGGVVVWKLERNSIIVGSFRGNRK